MDSDGDGYWDSNDPNPLDPYIPSLSPHPTYIPPETALLPKLRLYEPDNGARDVGIRVEDVGVNSEVWRVVVYFHWEYNKEVDIFNNYPGVYYRLQVDDDFEFRNPEINVTLCDLASDHCDNEYFSEEGLRLDEQYFWRVRHEHPDQGAGPWSEAWSFRTRDR